MSKYMQSFGNLVLEEKRTHLWYDHRSQLQAEISDIWAWLNEQDTAGLDAKHAVYHGDPAFSDHVHIDGMTPIPVEMAQSMTLAELNDHCAEMHGGYQPYKKKADAVAWHDSVHRNFENGSQRAAFMTVYHEHVAGDALPADVPLTMAGIENATFAKPMNREQRSILSALVDNDFNQTVQRISAETTVQMNAVANEVQQSFAAKRERGQEITSRAVEAFKYASNQVEGIIDALRATLEEINRELADEGVRAVNLPSVVSGKQWRLSCPDVVTIEVNGEQQAIAKAKADVQARASVIRAGVEAQRLAVKRIILEAGLPEDAKAFLNKLPSADAALEALKTEPGKEITAG